MNNRIGKQTVKLSNDVYIRETAAIVGKKEGEGPLSKFFDEILTDDRWDCDSWEKAESKIQKQTALKALSKTSLKTSDIDYILAGDLMNQCVASHYAIRDLQIPFLGVYGACSTMTESMSIGSMLVSGGFADRVMCMTSSHFCSAEKQFRMPLEYGGQRPPTAQWTVTGAGCAILENKGNGPRITHVTTGKIVDNGINDANNMGAAMAPAAADTLAAHFEDTGFAPSEYDLILTGDLGVLGSEILCDFMKQKGYDINKQHNDCGKLIFDLNDQDVDSGGSGCGCCGSVFCGYIMHKLRRKEFNKILVMATGALMNTTITQQGETIPSIAHAVTIEI